MGEKINKGCGFAALPGARTSRVYNAAGEDYDERVMSFPHPPPTRTESRVDVLAGVLVPDPYRWLEREHDSEVVVWMET